MDIDSSEAKSPSTRDKQGHDIDLDDDLDYASLLVLEKDFFRFEDMEEIEYMFSKDESFTINPDDKRRINAASGLPLNHKMPFTKLEVDLIKKQSAKGKPIGKLVEFFQRKESTIQSVIKGRYD